MYVSHDNITLRQKFLHLPLSLLSSEDRLEMAPSAFLLSFSVTLDVSVQVKPCDTVVALSAAAL